MIEGILQAILLLTSEVKRLLCEQNPDLDLAETRRLQQLVEDDLAFIRRWRERASQSHSGGNG